MKKSIVFVIVAALILGLVSCSSYTSSFAATMLIRSEGGNSCYAKWNTMNGRLVLDATKKTDGEGEIHFTASLDEGEMTVYYLVRGVGDEQKLELFTLKGGEQIDSRGGYVEKGNRVQIIIETNGKTKGGSVNIDFY